MEQIEKLIKEKTVDEKISCSDALAIAGTLGVPALDVARQINLMKIKIKQCQLGCFK